MGLNLGAFAGGVAKGISTQQDYNQRQQELKMRQQQADMQQQQFDRQKQDWGREDDFRKQSSQIMQDIYGEKTEDVTDPTTGQVTQKVTPASQIGMPGPDGVARDLLYTRKMIALGMKNAKDQSQLTPIIEHAKKLASTQVGQDVMGAYSGDPEAVKRLAASIPGGDPTKARMVDHETFDPGNGKPINVARYAAAAGALDAAGFIQQQHNQERSDRAIDTDIDYKKAETANAPLKGNLYRAQANRENARAANYGVGNTSKMGAQSVKEYATLQKTAPLVDPELSTDGKRQTWAEADNVRLALYQKARPGVKDPTQAWSQANTTTQQIVNAASDAAKRVMQRAKDGTLSAQDIQRYGKKPNPAQLQKQMFSQIVQQKLGTLQSPQMPDSDSSYNDSNSPD
jgi:hypothetical protein